MTESENKIELESIDGLSEPLFVSIFDEDFETLKRAVVCLGVTEHVETYELASKAIKRLGEGICREQESVDKNNATKHKYKYISFELKKPTNEQYEFLRFWQSMPFPKLSFFDIDFIWAKSKENNDVDVKITIEIE